VAGTAENFFAVAGEHGVPSEQNVSAAVAENTEKISVAAGEHGEPAAEGIASSDREACELARINKESENLGDLGDKGDNGEGRLSSSSRSPHSNLGGADFGEILSSTQSICPMRTR
jgi:hypothetical protein